MGTTHNIRNDEIWVDAANNTTSRFIRRGPDYRGELDGESIAISIDGRLYDRLSGAEIDTIDPPVGGCPQVEMPPSALILVYDFCQRNSALEAHVARFEARLETDAQFEGAPALALVYDVQMQPEEQPSPTPFSPQPPTLVPNIHTQTLVSRLYIERETKLPLAWTSESWDHDGRQASVIEGRFEIDFIPRSDLDADFFHPVTLLDPAPEIPVYWLGNSFDPGGELPRIVPRGIDLDRAGGASGRPTYQAHLSYSAPFSAQQWVTEVHIQEWASDKWEVALESGAVGSELWLYPCAEARPFEIDGGEAMIYLTYEPERESAPPSETGNCPDYKPDRFIGVVQFDRTVLLINGPFGNQLHPRNLGDGYDPYNSLEGMQAIIEGLQPWSIEMGPTDEASAPSSRDFGHAKVSG